MFRLLFALMAVATVFVGAAFGAGYVRPDTTTGVIVAAGDTLYALPATTARSFNINELPQIEATVTADDTLSLGNCYKIELRPFGAGAAGGVKYLIEDVAASWPATNTRSVTAYVFIGAADSVRVNAWLVE